jgi:hypothetical protein
VFSASLFFFRARKTRFLVQNHTKLNNQKTSPVGKSASISTYHDFMRAMTKEWPVTMLSVHVHKITTIHKKLFDEKYGNLNVINHDAYRI